MRAYTTPGQAAKVYQTILTYFILSITIESHYFFRVSAFGLSRGWTFQLQIHQCILYRTSEREPRRQSMQAMYWGKTPTSNGISRTVLKNKEANDFRSLFPPPSCRN